MIPRTGTVQRQAYDAGKNAALASKPRENPHTMRYNAKILYSWWFAGYDNAKKDAKP